MRRLVPVILGILFFVAACQSVGDPPPVVEPQPLLAENGQTIAQAAAVFYDNLADGDYVVLCFNLEGVDTMTFVEQSWGEADRIVFGPDAVFPNDVEHREALALYLETVQDNC